MNSLKTDFQVLKIKVTTLVIKNNYIKGELVCSEHTSSPFI